MSFSFSGLKAKSVSQDIVIPVDISRSRLMKVESLIDWSKLSEIVLDDLKKTEAGQWFRGRKISVRTHLGCYLLQRMFGLTDRATEEQLRYNGEYQVFCGNGIVENWKIPDHTKIETFRARLSSETECAIANFIAQMGVKAKLADPSVMDQDSTVQEANMAYPSDASLLVKMSRKIERVLTGVGAYAKKLAQGTSSFLSEKMREIGIKSKAYFFAKKNELKEKKNLLLTELHRSVGDLFAAFENVYSEKKVRLTRLKWNVRRDLEDLVKDGRKYLADVAHFLKEGTLKQGKILSFTMKEVACIVKGKAGKACEFGRVIQLGRLAGGLMIATPSKSIRNDDKAAVTQMLELHENLFGNGTLKSFGTDKGYFSSANLHYLEERQKNHGLTEFCLQKPGFDVKTFSPSDQEKYARLSARRTKIEPSIGHAKHNSQLRKSRMKSDHSSHAAAYGALVGYNLRQISYLQSLPKAL